MDLCVDAIDVPELLPFGYLVGDVTSIAVRLKGKPGDRRTQNSLQYVTTVKVDKTGTGVGELARSEQRISSIRSPMVDEERMRPGHWL